MKILLIYPECPATFWSFKHVLRFMSKKAAFPPLGLLTVAALLPQEWDIKLVDVNVEELTDEQIKWADMVFISAMLIQNISAKEIIARCKQFKKTVVAGGPAFTTSHEQYKGVDHFVLNEAEVTLPIFLKDLAKGTLKKIYSSEERPDIVNTPIPLWSLINFKDYITMVMQYSRGCPFNCEFCDIIIMNGRTPRTKTSQQTINELQSLYDAGWRGSLFIVDDNFIGNKVKVKEMLRRLIKWQEKHKYPFRLFTEASMDLARDKELMRLMSAANFNKVFLGLETPDTISLKECGKLQNMAMDPVKAVKIISQHGMQVMGGFIVGFDSDKENIFEAQFKFIQKIGVVTAMVGILNALPQTRLWHRLKAEGRLLKDTTGENTNGLLNFIPKMDKTILVDGYKKMMAKLYSPRIYYQRINIFLKNYKPTAKGGISRDSMKAFFRSMWRIGILSRSSPYYWKLLFKTLATDPRKLHVAIEMAISEQHFRKVAKNIKH